MARQTRRSARLQKNNRSSQSPDISTEDVASAKAVDLSLPSLAEQDETMHDVEAKVDTAAKAASRGDSSKSPLTSNKILSMLSPVAAKTPRNKTPLRPSTEEMHPELHHRSTTTPYEEATNQGILARGAQTAPPKGTTSQLAIAQATPTKAFSPTRNPFLSPDFKFHFKKQSEVELSPTAKRMMEDTRKEAAKMRATVVAATESATATPGTPGRKIKTPKGVAGRFSDAHKKQFDRMDSIANHPSAYRADPGRLNSPTKSLKRSPSKAGLDKGDDSLVDTKPTVRIVPPSRHGEAPSMSMASSKRIKRQEGEDTSTRPLAREASEQKMPRSPHGHGVAPINTSTVPRPAFFTPTRSSMARTQSVRTTKTAPMTSPLKRTNSVLSTASSRSKIEGVLQAGIRKTSSGINRVKSILRSPQRHFSNDPLKIAAGTHMSSFSFGTSTFQKALPAVPATAPVVKTKHVDFTASAVEKAERDEALASPTPRISNRSASAVHSRARVEYPTLPSIDEPQSPSRQLSPSDLQIPGSFHTHRQASAEAAVTSTIRRVRTSDVNLTVPDSPRKRKLDQFDETAAEKENFPAGMLGKEKAVVQEAAEEGRPVKKMRTAAPEQMKSTSSPMKTPSRVQKILGARRGGLTPSRLNFLAMPKRRRE